MKFCNGSTCFKWISTLGWCFLLSANTVFANTGYPAMPISDDSTKLTVMTFNIENGGTQIDFRKVVEAIKKSKADVVGIQEAWGNIDRLANLLNWKYFSRKQHIVSRLPLVEAGEISNHYLLIEIGRNKFVAMANIHLPDSNYGPDSIMALETAKNVIDNEKKIRLKSALPIISDLVKLAKMGMPVFLTGDFNSPSHLDWSPITMNKSCRRREFRHHRYALMWPVTKTFELNGFVDSFRSIHKDPIQYPGFTWPAYRPSAKHSYDGYNPSEKDLADRIDFIFTAGQSKTIDSFVMGEKKHTAKENMIISPWPSDHRALVSTFIIKPFSMKKFEKLIPNTNKETKSSSKAMSPQVFVSSQTVRVGESFRISWKNSPGNRYDYIRINPILTTKTELNDMPRLYTHATINGSLKYSSKHGQGNWLLWNQATHTMWPLKPGIYDIKLMLDDSETELAATKVEVLNSRSSESST